MSGTALFFDESEDVINVLLCCATECYAMLSYCINSMGFVSEHCLPFHGTLGSYQMYMHVLDLSNWIGWFTDPTPFAPVEISRAPDRYLTVPPDASPNSVLMSQVHLAQSPLVPSTSDALRSYLNPAIGACASLQADFNQRVHEGGNSIIHTTIACFSRASGLQLERALILIGARTRHSSYIVIPVPTSNPSKVDTI
ncbi:hypothetical protein CI102_12515 [Trichoderma harzianum]|nr:hypothetical protein CI102_12515 [Trichoderma harzianum]